MLKNVFLITVISPALRSSGAGLKMMSCFWCQERVPENSHSTFQKDVNTVSVCCKSCTHGPLNIITNHE